MLLRTPSNSKRLFLLMVCSSAVLGIRLLSACFGPRLFEECGYVVSGVLAVIAAFWILKFAFGWLSAQDLFAPWVAFPIAYVLWFSIGSIDVLGDSRPPPYRVIGLGLVCYLTGMWLSRFSSPHRKCISFATFRYEWSADRFRLILSVTVAVALLAYLSIALQVGVPALHSDVGEKRLELLRTGKSQFIFVFGAWTVIVFLATRLWTGNQTLVRTASKKIWFALLVASLFVLSLGSRGTLLIPIATIVIARHYLYRKIRVLRALLIGGLMFVAASALGWARDTMAFAETGLKNLEFDASSLYYLYFYVRNSVTTLRDIIEEIPRHVPFQHGYLSLGALASVLPGHHESSDMFFRRVLGLDFLGFGQPATLLGPMYGDFGIPGVVFQMLLLGFCYTRLYSWMLGKPNLIRVLIYAWVSQTVLFSLFGSLFTYFIDLAVPIGWVLLNSFLVTREADERIIVAATAARQG